MIRINKQCFVLFCLLKLLTAMMTKHYEEFEDTKGVIRICISKKNRQHNGQKSTKGQTTIYKLYT